MLTKQRLWEPADLPAETVREARAVSRELALDSALRRLLEALGERGLSGERIEKAIKVATATRAGVRDARMAEGWAG